MTLLDQFPDASGFSPRRESGRERRDFSRRLRGLAGADAAAPQSEWASNLTFFLKYLRDPQKVGAIAPSGPTLASLITSEIRPGMGPILELGAGSGIFTAALLTRGIPASDIVAVELDGAFAERLRTRFPGLTVIHGAAEKALRYSDSESQIFGAVVSGLPLLNFPWRTRQRLMRLVFDRLRPGGAMYQFTYGLGTPVSRLILESLDLESECIGRVFRNIPPAAVYRIRRRGDADLIAGRPQERIYV